MVGFTKKNISIIIQIQLSNINPNKKSRELCIKKKL